MTLDLLKATIHNYNPKRMNDEDASNLELLLSLPAFESVWDLVEDKLEEFYEHLRNNPVYSFNGETATEKPSPVPPVKKRKPRAKEAAQGQPKPVREIQFKVINGILVPIQS